MGEEKMKKKTADALPESAPAVDVPAVDAPAIEAARPPHDVRPGDIVNYRVKGGRCEGEVRAAMVLREPFHDGAGNVFCNLAVYFDGANDINAFGHYGSGGGVSAWIPSVTFGRGIGQWTPRD